MTDAGHILDGALVRGSGETVSRLSPVSREPLAQAPLASAAQGEEAAAAATRAAPRMANLTLGERRAVLLDLAILLDNDGTELATQITLETGCPAAQALSLQIGSAVGLLRAYADLLSDHAFVEEREGRRGGRTRIIRHPVGVALGIVPWNVPVFLACMKLAPAIAAGCPILLKPSPESADSMGLFARMLATLDLPAGGVQSLTGGAALGRQLVDDGRFAKISFTGSTAAGRQVGIAAAQRFARTTLELGGKSAAILLDDLDPSGWPAELWLAMFQNNGQVCGAKSRILVPHARMAAFEDGLAAMIEGLTVGDPRSGGTQIGPVVSLAAAKRIDEAVSADVAAGGTRLTQAASRSEQTCAFVTPSLLRPSRGDAPIVLDELFGPVVTVQPYESEDEAVRMANDHRYGLSGSVWSADPERAARLAVRLKTGTVGINTKKILDFGSPFGGWRDSGVGRELGPEGINAYTETTTLILP